MQIAFMKMCKGKHRNCENERLVEESKKYVIWCKAEVVNEKGKKDWKRKRERVKREKISLNANYVYIWKIEIREDKMKRKMK